MADCADVADAYVQLDLERALEAQRQRAALQGLPESMDGRCMECGTAISTERLAALPKTGRCIDCARLAEIIYREKAWLP